MSGADAAGDAAADDDDVTVLSPEAMAALQEFYSEQAARDDVTEGAMPQEDWQLSQFWYSDVTATKLAEEAIAAAGPHGSVACLSCPTLYERLRQLMPATLTAKVLEFDQRFAKYGPDFVLYDYSRPGDLGADLHGQFDLVVADPPFLSEECLTKTAVAIKLLTRGKVLLCTGAVMADLATRLLHTHTLDFRPEHKNQLGNEFRCYANYSTTVIS